MLQTRMLFVLSSILFYFFLSCCLILLFADRFSGIHLPVNEIALTSEAQIHKLQVTLKELDQRLGLEDRSRIKWDVKRESRSQMGFGSKATSRQMFLVPSWQTDSQRDLLLPQQTLKLLALLALGKKNP